MTKKAKEQQVFGLDAMVDAIYEELQKSGVESVKSTTKKAIKAVLKAEQELIVGAVSEGDKVTYIGFGTYEARQRSERKGRNPQTGEEMTIPAKTAPAFKPGKAFKDAVK